MGRVYTARFLRTLRGKYRAKRPLIGDALDGRRVLAARTFREFDDAATAPLHGFRDADHYYAASSSARFLAGIRVPTLLLHSADDLFLPSDRRPPRRRRATTPSITAAFTEHGGHVGFVAGTPWAPEFWAEAEAARFLAGQLGGAA